MPRVTIDRPAAQPRSPRQRARHHRILRAATRLGAQLGLDGVQMQDVAREADVAVGTLYRYFPSKTHLFTAVMGAQVDRMSKEPTEVDAAAQPVEAVTETLLRSTRHLLRTPLLASAIMQSNRAAHAATVSEAARIDEEILHIVLRLLALDQPTEHDERLVRLLLKAWHGVLTSALSYRSTGQRAEKEIRLACQVLLAARSNAPRS